MRQIESFFWGIIAALGALFFQLLVFIIFSFYSNPNADLTFAQFFIMPQFVIAAACIEEMFKYLIIAKRVDMYSLEKSYIINSLFVGAGFFATEFALIASSANFPSRQILAELAIIHMGTAGLMGYRVAIKNPKKFLTFFSTLVMVLIFHAGYNFLILQRNFYQNIAIVALLAFLLIINLLNLLKISYKLAQS